MTKKITLTTIKSFINKNRTNLYTKQESRFDGMVDCVMPVDGAKFRPARYIDGYGSCAGIALGTLSSGNHFQVFAENGYEGFRVSNCCGSTIVAIKIGNDESEKEEDKVLTINSPIPKATIVRELYHVSENLIIGTVKQFLLSWDFRADTKVCAMVDLVITYPEIRPILEEVATRAIDRARVLISEDRSDLSTIEDYMTEANLNSEPKWFAEQISCLLAFAANVQEQEDPSANVFHDQGGDEHGRQIHDFLSLLNKPNEQ